jgi:hypothetical protein
VVSKVHTFLRDLLDDLPSDIRDQTAHALLSWLLGTVVQQHVHPRPATTLRHELHTLVHGPAIP